MPKLSDMSPCGVSTVAHLLHCVSPSNRLPNSVATWVGAHCGISDLAQRVRNVFEMIDWQRSDFRVSRHVVGFSTLYNVLQSNFFAMALRNGGVMATCDVGTYQIFQARDFGENKNIWLSRLTDRSLAKARTYSICATRGR